jgi:hypothetical protein
MKKFVSAIVLIAFGMACQSTDSGQEQQAAAPDQEQQASDQQHQHHSPASAESAAANGEQKKPLSPHTSAMAMIGDAHIHIDYSSPRVRNRMVFGGLVAMDEVWVSGAHRATWLETNKALRMGGNVLPAGKYALFTIPGQEQWTVILNRNWDQHGKDDYNQQEDVFRFKVHAQTLTETQEELVWEVNKNEKMEREGSISLAWEKKKISFPFEVVR